MSDDDPDGYKTKLIETKERWARDGRVPNPGVRPGLPKLPPGQRLVTDWPVLDLGKQPEVSPGHWRLRVDGLVETPLLWDFQTLLAQPETEDVSDMHCVTAWSRFDNRWVGVAASHVLALAKPTERARYVMLHSYDGYTTNLPLRYFAEPDSLLVHSWEGKPITRAHGGPVRALVPKLYLWKSAKWLKRIELMAEDRTGFWEARGYHNLGNPWREQRYG
jgi:DMSO/TMAO reductase YedYZ molybdopterin-dependent catalytic subunit